MDDYVLGSLDRYFRPQEIDIVFVVGCTQSMNNRIRDEVSTGLRRIVERLLSNYDVHHALVQYRGHVPEHNADYVVGQSNFTRDLPGILRACFEIFCLHCVPPSVINRMI